MFSSKVAGSLLVWLVVSVASVACAEWLDLFYCTAVSSETRPVSVFTTPDGSGESLGSCSLYTGGVTDATIVLTLIDGEGLPIVGYPVEDMWLATYSGGAVFCPGGSVADVVTDANGMTIFSGPLRAGGSSDHAGGEGCIVLINGNTLYQAPMPIYINSADISGDFIVDISDVVIFAGDYFGVYAYRSDFHWDGMLNISDIVKLAPAFGATCQ